MQIVLQIQSMYLNLRQQQVMRRGVWFIRLWAWPDVMIFALEVDLFGCFHRFRSQETVEMFGQKRSNLDLTNRSMI